MVSVDHGVVWLQVGLSKIHCMQTILVLPMEQKEMKWKQNANLPAIICS